MRSASGTTAQLNAPTTSVSFTAKALTGSDWTSGPASSPPALIGSVPRIPYPEPLQSVGRRESGEVVVEFAVDTTGRPDMSTLKIVSSANNHFTEAVRKAIPSLRFEPAQQRGRKAKAPVQIQFRFSPTRP